MSLNPNTEHLNSFFNLFLFFDRKKSLGGGIVLNSSVYTIQFCQLVFKQAPKSIKILESVLNDDGVDVELSIEMGYSNDAVAKIKHSFLTLQRHAAKIIGTNGELTVSVILFFLGSKIKKKSSFSVYFCFFSGAQICLSYIYY